jgi:hypothetical protein
MALCHLHNYCINSWVNGKARFKEPVLLSTDVLEIKAYGHIPLERRRDLDLMTHLWNSFFMEGSIWTMSQMGTEDLQKEWHQSIEEI